MGEVPMHAILGVMRDGNAHETPPGGLYEGKNLSLLRPGCAEPRPGFSRVHFGGVTSQSFVQALTTSDGSSIGAVLANLTGTDVGVLSGFTATGKRSTSAVSMRGCYWLNASDGLRKTEGASFNVTNKANALGVPLVDAAFGSGVSLGAGSAFAYRALLARFDVNNNIWTYGQPSGRLIVDNNNASARSYRLYIYLPSTGAAANDYLIVYRTRSTSADPDDEMGEVWRYQITSSDLSTGYVTRDDALADDDRGVALYSNPSRGGIAASNIEPPYALTLAEYRGCLFAANIKTRWRKVVTFDEGNSISGKVGAITITGTRTNNSAVIAVASATGLQVGMMLGNVFGLSSWSGSGPVRIASISSTNITMSATWTGSTDASPASCTFVDSIRIGSEYHPMHTMSTARSQVLAPIYSIQNGWSYFRTSASTSFRAYSLEDSQRVYYSSYGSIDHASFVIEEITPGSTNTAPEVFASHGTLYEEPLPLTSASEGAKMEREAIENGIAWSKQNEPMHFTLAGYDRVGTTENAAIVAMRSVGESLFIFQSNGDVWRLYGYGPRTGWKTDRVARGITLVGPRALDAMGDACFALASEGLFVVTESGFQSLSRGQIDELIGNPKYNASAAYFVCAHPRRREVLFGASTGTSGDSAVPTWLWSYSLDTKRWSDWVLTWTPTDCVYAQGSYIVVTGAAVGPLAAQEVTSTAGSFAANTAEPYAHSDGPYSGLVSDSRAGNEYELYFTGSESSAVPAVGDVIASYTSGGTLRGYWVITRVIDADWVTVASDTDAVLPNTGDGGTDTIKLFKSYECSIVWRELALGSAMTRKHWEQFVVSAESASGMRYATVVCDSATNSESTASKQYTYAASGPRTFRFIVPRKHASARWLRPGIRIKQAGCNFVIDGVQVKARVIGERTARL